MKDGVDKLVLPERSRNVENRVCCIAPHFTGSCSALTSL